MKALLGCSGHFQDRGPRIRLCGDLKVESLTAPASATALPNVQPWLPELPMISREKPHTGAAARGNP